MQWGAATQAQFHRHEPSPQAGEECQRQGWAEFGKVLSNDGPKGFEP